MPRYDDYSREELVRLLEARDRRDATRFGLVWETNEVERKKALNGDLDKDDAWRHSRWCEFMHQRLTLAKELRAKGVPGVIVYTWQPGLMADRLAGSAHIQVETIPQSLALKFGLGRRRA